MISDAIALYEFLRKHWDEYIVISAMFSHDGKFIAGDRRIKVKKIPVKGRTDMWFYRVDPLDDYIFIHFPVNPGAVYIDNGKLSGESNPDARLFRYVGNPLAHFESGGSPNVKVDFIVVGYKAKDLLKLKEKLKR